MVNATEATTAMLSTMAVVIAVIYSGAGRVVSPHSTMPTPSCAA